MNGPLNYDGAQVGHGDDVDDHESVCQVKLKCSIAMLDTIAMAMR